ncbi:MAG: hypothetical protein WCI30_03820 [Clostridia bacterium]
MKKQNLEEALQRVTELFSESSNQKIYAKMQVISPTLREYALNHPEGATLYPDLGEREEFWRRLTAESNEILDDSIPSAYMSEFDEGLYGGLLGAEVRYLDNPEWGWVSSMCVPFVQKLEELADINFDKNCPLAQQYLQQLKYFVEASKGDYGISHFILIDGLNALLELRGATNMYYDCMDAPELVEQFFALTRELNYWVQDNFFEIVGLYRGGTCSNLCQWIPGKIVSESLDPFHMASVKFFEQWGRKQIEEIFAHYDGGSIHIHTGNGLHLVKPAATLKGLKMIAFIDENFNELKAYHQLQKIHQDRGNVPIFITIPYEEFVKMLTEKVLVGKAMYAVTNVPTVEIANKLMEKVKAYSY